VGAHQRVALLLLGLRQVVVVRHHLDHVAADHAHLAHAAAAVAAAVVERQARLQARLQQRVVTLDAELVPAGLERDLGRDHFEDVVHDVEPIDRFGGQHARQTLLQIALQREQARIIAGSLAHHLLQPVLQLGDQRVIALQVALHVGQLLPLAEQALGEHVLAGQHALAHAAAEGVLLDVHDALEHPRVHQLGLRVQRQQVLGRDQAVGQRDLARAHALLQHAARHPHQLGRAPDGHPLSHACSAAARGAATRSR
jgi:hypothetical protein